MFRILLALFLPVAILVGQGGPPVAKGKRGVLRDQIVAHLHRVRTERLQQSLGISEEKAKAIADRWAKFDADSQEQRQRMRQLHRQANTILLGPLPEEEKNAQIRPLVEQVSALRLQQHELRRKFEEDIQASLTPAQQARFILVMEEIQRALMEAIREQRGGRGPEISGQ